MVAVFLDMKARVAVSLSFNNPHNKGTIPHFLTAHLERKKSVVRKIFVARVL